MESRPLQALGGVRCIDLFNGERVLLFGGIHHQLADDHILDSRGRMIARPGTGESIEIDAAIAPDLAAQVKDILGAGAEGTVSLRLIDAGVVGPLQGVVDVHELFRTGFHRVLQRPLLIAPEDGLDPGVHVPGVPRVPYGVYTGGHCCVREGACGVGVVVGHHHFHRGICDGGGVPPGLALQAAAHAAALCAAETHGSFAAVVVIHLVELAAAQACRLIRHAGIAKPLQRDGIGPGRLRPGGDQPQYADQRDQDCHRPESCGL